MLKARYHHRYGLNVWELFFLHTPAPYWLGFYLLLYHNSPGRLFRPFKERKGLDVWEKVLLKLKLVEKIESPHANPDVLIYIICAATAAAASVVSSLALVPFIFAPLASPYGWAAYAAAQAFSAIPLAMATKKYCGRLPAPKRSAHLKYPRLGSRVRHLADPELEPGSRSRKSKSKSKPEPEPTPIREAGPEPEPNAGASKDSEKDATASDRGF